MTTTTQIITATSPSNVGLADTLMNGEYPPETYMRGTLRLRGSHQVPESGVFPELDTNGVSNAIANLVA